MLRLSCFPVRGLWGLPGVFLLLLEPNALKEVEHHMVDERIADKQNFLA